MKAPISLLLPVLCIIGLSAPAGAGNSEQSAEGASVVRGRCAPDNGGISLPEGFCAQVAADNLGPVRHIVIRENGDLYARLRTPRKGGGIVALRDNDGDGSLEQEERFFDDGGTGIGIWQDYLYFATPGTIYRSKLIAGKLLPAGKIEMVVSDFPPQEQHAAKSFALSGKGDLFVNIGAPSNVCQKRNRTEGSPGIDPCPQLKQHAGIWRFGAGTTGQKMADGDHFATGIRNAVAIAWDRT
ncbi:hypothetical protein [Desulfuromonas sp. TF]|uniref:hypothetical protein n=1 Tax=Desulfuromonas sp. TF TaxID=1232410 RepID=UPI00041FC569|nr:hypothetical protein [Desulfuromonas sp. TF]